MNWAWSSKLVGQRSLNSNIRTLQVDRASEAFQQSNKYLVRSKLMSLGCSHRPLPAITEPAGLNVAEMALLIWFLLWLPTYEEESCCLQRLPPSLSHLCAIWLTDARICWQAQFQGQPWHLPVVSLMGRMQNTELRFQLHEAHGFTFKIRDFFFF